MINPKTGGKIQETDSRWRLLTRAEAWVDLEVWIALRAKQRIASSQAGE